MRRWIAASLIALAVAGGCVLLLRESGPAEVATPIATAPATHGRVIAARPLPRLPLPTLPATAGTPEALDLSQLDARDASLVADDRRAWLLSELVDGGSDMVPHAITTDGRDFALEPADRVLVVRRASGALYVGFLNDGAAANGALADIERPAERIDDLARITLVPAVPVVAAPAIAQLTVLVDGEVAGTFVPDSFASAATTVLDGKHAAPAIEIEKAFRGARIVGLEADGNHVELHPPRKGARAVVYMNRRWRFKFAWVDRSGRPIGDEQREVTQVALRTDRDLRSRL